VAAGLIGALSLASCSSPSGTGTISTTLTASFANVPTGTFILGGSGSEIHVQVSLHGLGPGKSYGAALASGTCLSGPATSAVSFGSFDASSTGTAQTTLSGTGSLEALASPLRFVVLPTGVPTSSTPVGCTDLTRSSLTSAQELFPDPGHKPFGKVVLAYAPSSESLRVQISAEALDASTTETATIDRGSCAAQGRVLYHLKNLAVSADRRADTTTVVSGVRSAPPASGWYAVVSSHGLPVLCADLVRNP
jgi:hypothetical protein